MFNKFIESEEKSYEHYDKGYGLRKHPRVLLTLPVELTYREEQEPLSFECEAKDISALGMFLKFVSLKEELHPLVGKSVEIFLPRQKPIAEKCGVKGKFAWASKPVENPEDGLYYTFCGVQFDEELPLSLQLEQMAISAHRTLEKLVVFYKLNLVREHYDPLEHMSEMWIQSMRNIPELSSLRCVYWYYYAPKDVFIKNSMRLNEEGHGLRRLVKDAVIRENLMEHRIPISDTEFSQRVFYPLSNETDFPYEEKSLYEWLFPLFDEDEFLGLTQLKFQKELNTILGADKMFWLCIHICNYASSKIKSEEIKRDNDYSDILPQILKLNEDQCDKKELYEFYSKILSKLTEVTGEIPSFLNLFSENHFIGEKDVSSPALHICAFKNLKDADKNNIIGKRMIKNDEIGCCPQSLLLKHTPHFCEINCSPNKNSQMYCVPFYDKELIAVACFAVSKDFMPTQRLVRRIIEVSQTSSLLIQLCLRLVPNMHINYVLGCENDVF